ncbi:MAG: hypothetical protein IT385_27255 [Deltaproteobacteria bacterium]|nr:hypothetical protein [Deltaproteobacteria bacterium]
MGGSLRVSCVLRHLLLATMAAGCGRTDGGEPPARDTTAPWWPDVSAISVVGRERGAVRLAWTPAIDDTTFVSYRLLVDRRSMIAHTPGATAWLGPGSRHRVEVVAVDRAGNESAQRLALDLMGEVVCETRVMGAPPRIGGGPK